LHEANITLGNAAWKQVVGKMLGTELGCNDEEGELLGGELGSDEKDGELLSNKLGESLGP